MHVFFSFFAEMSLDHVFGTADPSNIHKSSQRHADVMYVRYSLFLMQ
jgi:hypothetical protein